MHPLTRYCTVTADNSRGVSRKDSFPNEFIWLKEWKRDCQMITEEDRFLQRGMTYKYIHIVYTASEQARHSQRLVQKRTMTYWSSFHTWSLQTDARRQLRLICAGMIHKFLSVLLSVLETSRFFPCCIYGIQECLYLRFLIELRILYSDQTETWLGTAWLSAADLKNDTWNGEK